MDPIFQPHRLSQQGLHHAEKIAEIFDNVLGELKCFCKPDREFAICKTKLEEACFYAKKSMASDPSNQEGYENPM